MNFKLVTCPKCDKKQILEYMICGTPCSCGVSLHSDDEQNKKDVRKQWKESADAFSHNFDEFRERLKSEEKFWNKHNVFVAFQTVTIPNEELLKLIKT